MDQREPYKPDDDIVERAAAALRDVGVPEGPSEDLLAGTLSAIRRAEGSAGDTSAADVVVYSSKRRILTMRFMTKLAVAAVIALVVGSLVWVTDPLGGRPAFAEVLQKVQQVRSVRFKMDATVRDGSLPGGEQSTKGTMTIVGSRMRQEMVIPTPPIVPGGPMKMVSVMDLEKGEMLSLMEQQKTAMRMKMENVPQQMKDQNLLERFRQMKAGGAKLVGRRELDGRTVEVYRVEEDGQAMTIWADPETRLPVRIEAESSIPMLPKSHMVMTEFSWDVEVDEALMSLEPPPGYSVQRVSFDMSDPTEKDLIQSLRKVAEWNGGQFPDAFGMQGMTAGFVKQMFRQKGKDGKPDDALQQEMTKEMVQISRGFMFVLPKNGDEFHYAGKGAKVGEAGRAVMWYRPAKSETYRVIDADFTVREVKPEELPKVEAEKLDTKPQVMLGGAAPTTKPAAK